MAEKGLDFIIQIEDAATPGSFQTIGGFRSNGMSVNSETVDITSKKSNGWRALLAGAGVRSMSLSGAGVFDNDAYFRQCMQHMLNSEIATYRLLVPNYGQFEGRFQITSLDMGGEHNGEVTYSLSLESAGEISLTITTGS